LAAFRRKLPGLGLLPGSASEADAEVSPLRRSRTQQPLRARARVAILTGCVGDRLAPGINRDTVEVLQRNGIEVVDVEGQQCCGALPMHAGFAGEAAALASANAKAFAAADVDFIVTTAAGCGAMMRDYGHVLHGTEDQDAACDVAASSRDICELLVELGFEKPEKPLAVAGEVAYHDACHLLHARSLAAAPRQVCEAALGRPTVDLGENAICCGSAGSYNLDHPAISEQLGARKAELTRERKAAMVAVGNIGCLLQISRSLALAGIEAPVRHPIQLLAEAYRQSDSSGSTTW
jgi:glycolate oxidase iron-sulfur subunit